MKSMLISYDLRSPGRNYDDLYDVIKSFPDWAHITESTWCVKTHLDCVELRDKLCSVLDRNDRMFVAELTGVAAWRNVLCGSDKLQEIL